MKITEERLNKIVSETINEAISELTGGEMRIPKIKPGSEDEQKILELLKDDLSKQAILNVAKMFKCSTEAIETVLRRHGILPKFASTRNLMDFNREY